MHPGQKSERSTDFKVQDYWYHSTAHQHSIPPLAKPVIGKLSLRELIGDEEKLIADYEARKEARRQRRIAEAQASQ